MYAQPQRRVTQIHNRNLCLAAWVAVDLVMSHCGLTLNYGPAEQEGHVDQAETQT